MNDCDHKYKDEEKVFSLMSRHRYFYARHHTDIWPLLMLLFGLGFVVDWFVFEGERYFKTMLIGIFIESLLIAVYGKKWKKHIKKWERSPRNKCYPYLRAKYKPVHRYNIPLFLQRMPKMSRVIKTLIKTKEVIRDNFYIKKTENDKGYGPR